MIVTVASETDRPPTPEHPHRGGASASAQAPSAPPPPGPPQPEQAQPGPAQPEPAQPGPHARPPVPDEVSQAETGLNVFIEAWQRALEELGCLIPPAQLRALLVIDDAGQLNLTALATELGASPSAASKLCSRLEAAGLVTRETAALSRREILLAPTESGRELAGWVREQRQAVVTQALAQLSPARQQDLARALAELGGRTAGR
jgi:DNA-binding MarR family transcriptional regulator